MKESEHSYAVKKWIFLVMPVIFVVGPVLAYTFFRRSGHPTQARNTESDSQSFSTKQGQPPFDENDGKNEDDEDEFSPCTITP